MSLMNFRQPRHAGGQRRVQFLALVAEQPSPARAELVRLVKNVEGGEELFRDKLLIEQKPGLQRLPAAPLA